MSEHSEIQPHELRIKLFSFIETGLTLCGKNLGTDGAMAHFNSGKCDFPGCNLSRNHMIERILVTDDGKQRAKYRLIPIERVSVTDYIVDELIEGKSILPEKEWPGEL